MKRITPQLLQSGDVLRLPHRDFMVLARDGNMLWLTDCAGDVTTLPLSIFDNHFMFKETK